MAYINSFVSSLLITKKALVEFSLMPIFEASNSVIKASNRSWKYFETFLSINDTLGGIMLHGSLLKSKSNNMNYEFLQNVLNFEKMSFRTRLSRRQFKLFQSWIIAISVTDIKRRRLIYWMSFKLPS